MSRVISDAQRRRAAMFAALGEPVRLAIAEALSHGDLAGKELAHRFALPTNLLAHHLSVLDDAGVVRRRRSEGDGRRTYLQLRLEDPLVMSLIAPTLPPQSIASRVVFVCTHNSARSQLAAAEWTRVSEIPAASAGTQPAQAIHARAIETANRHKLGLRARSTRHIRDVVRADDLVVAVCDRAHEQLATTSHPDGLHWSVPDPVLAGDAQAFEVAYQEISTRIRRLAPELTKRQQPSTKEQR